MSEVCVSSTTVYSGSASPADPSRSPPFSIVLVTDRPDLADHVARLVRPVRVNLSVTGEFDAPQMADADLVLLDVPPGDRPAFDRARAAASRLRESPAPVLVADGRLSAGQRTALYQAGVLDCIALDLGADELAAKLASYLKTCRAAPAALRRLREHARHLDDQLRFAQRLQMDFLPHSMPDVRGAQFAARLEPAAWVAGDFYDVFRLDERRLGFYVADAVGHGIPAALLTVFVKKSLQTKRIEGKHYELIEPGEALRLLNVDLISAELRETPFITMCYGIYDEQTRCLAHARAGHPLPLHLSAGGRIDALDAEGPLLGIFPDAEYDTAQLRLEPGDRLLVYSDGAERLAEEGHGDDPDRLTHLVRIAALLPLEAMLDAILEGVHAAARGGPPADDVTLVALGLNTDDPR